MTLLRSVALAVLLGSIVASKEKVTPPQAQQSCWQAPAALTTPTLNMLRARVSATGTSAEQFRATVGLLQDSADSVYLVNDEALCHRGAVALTLFKGNGDTLNLHPVLVIKAGRSRFVLDDGATKAGEFMSSYVADTSFAILGGLVY